MSPGSTRIHAPCCKPSPPGMCWGGRGCSPPYYWHFDARALEETDALVMFGTRLRELCESDKALGYEIMKRVADVVVHRLQTARLKLVGERVEADRLPE